MNDMTTSIAPLEVREQFVTDPDLGAGNFLDNAYAANPNRAVPFAFSHHLDHRGEVVLKGHSLEDLVRLRDRYARWYWANGVRPGEPVGVVIAEGLPPLLHFLALSALGAIPALVNDAMRAGHHGPLPRPRRRGGRGGRRPDPADDRLRATARASGRASWP